MVLRRHLQCALLVGTTVCLLPVVEPATAHADDRWPLWPTEVQRVRDRIKDTAGSTESERHAAFLRLHAYATPLIKDIVIKGADDPASLIRREALRACYLRQLSGCIPAAVRAWNIAGDSGERSRALKVIALDPTEARASLLFSALREPDEGLRRHAIQLIASAPFDAAGLDEARGQLLAKLTDASAHVRADTVEALARIGGLSSSLPIVRLLEDPDPGVRESAARALGAFADPRTMPALVRAIDHGGPTSFVRDAISSLAAIPGKEVDAELLRLFETPPEDGGNRNDIAMAIGRRPDVDELLIEGLIDRLRDDALRSAALVSLQRLGDAPLPALRGALARGVAPSLELAIERLIQAREEPTETKVAIPPRPPFTDRVAWHQLLAGRGQRRTDALALELVAANPPWLEAAIADAVQRAGQAADARPWLIALATKTGATLHGKEHRHTWMRVAAWAADSRAPASDRCLAIGALGAAAGSKSEALVASELRPLLAAASIPVRTCLGMVWGRLAGRELQANELLVLLRDPSEQVRAGAALGAASLSHPEPELIAALSVQAESASDAPVRSSARWALARLAARDGRRGRGSDGAVVARLVARSEPISWGQPTGWLGIETEGLRLHVPSVGTSIAAPSIGATQPGAWALVPDLGDFEAVESPVAALPRRGRGIR